jgi:hypothetical protein
MELRVNSERGRIYRLISNNNVTGVINTDEIGYFHQFEIFPKRVDPEAVWEFGISDGDMACDTFCEPKSSENS